MDWGNAIVRGVEKDQEGRVTEMRCDLHLEGDVKKTKLKVTWLADVPHLVDLLLEEYDHLITKRKVEARERPFCGDIGPLIPA